MAHENGLIWTVINTNGKPQTINNRILKQITCQTTQKYPTLITNNQKIDYLTKNNYKF